MLLSLIPISNVFDYNYRVLVKNLEGIDHEMSLLPPPGGVNSVNWVLGHIVLARDGVLSAMGMETLCPQAMENQYGAGAGIEKLQNLGTILMLLDGSQEMIREGLGDWSRMAETSPEFKEMLMQLSGLSFHEAYHAGQLGILRRQLGLAGAIQ